jgi:hypothetical protein
MSIDTYGLPSEQYEEFFEDNVAFSAKLYVKSCQILKDNGAGAIDFKTTLDLYQEAVYQTNDDCRRYQKANNPDAIKENDLLGSESLQGRVDERGPGCQCQGRSTRRLHRTAGRVPQLLSSTVSRNSGRLILPAIAGIALRGRPGHDVKLTIHLNTTPCLNLCLPPYFR